MLPWHASITRLFHAYAMSFAFYAIYAAAFITIFFTVTPRYCRYFSIAFAIICCAIS